MSGDRARRRHYRGAERPGEAGTPRPRHYAAAVDPWSCHRPSPSREGNKRAADAMRTLATLLRAPSEAYDGLAAEAALVKAVEDLARTVEVHRGADARGDRPSASMRAISRSPSGVKEGFHPGIADELGPGLRSPTAPLKMAGRRLKGQEKLQSYPQGSRPVRVARGCLL